MILYFFYGRIYGGGSEPFQVLGLLCRLLRSAVKSRKFNFFVGFELSLEEEVHFYKILGTLMGVLPI